MPIPKPKKYERKKKFISRCMKNKVMKKDYPKLKQRFAVCYSTWKKNKK